MYQCATCGQWITQGNVHFCNPAQYQPVYYYTVTEQLQPTLERIAKALEALVEQKKSA
jgi:hypothetical protein